MKAKKPPKKAGRPIKSGSLTAADGMIRACLHTKRLRAASGRLCAYMDAREIGHHKVAKRMLVEMRDDAVLIDLAIQAIELLSAKNRELGRIIGRTRPRHKLEGRGVCFTTETAADGIADLAGDMPMTVYVGRDPRFIRAMSGDRLPRGATLIGRYDEGCDIRVVRADIKHAIVGKSARLKQVDSAAT
jgi:hypothetical protein